MSRLNVGYVIFNEPPWVGVARTQAVELVREISRSAEHYEFVVIAFLPAVSYWTDAKHIQATRASLQACGAQLLAVPTPFLFSRYFLVRWFLLPIFILSTVPALLLLTMRLRLDLLHARSYPAGLAALLVKKMTGTRFVFDARSNFPEEHVTARDWSRNSLTYKMWKSFEVRLLQDADCVVALTKSLAKYYRDICPKSKVKEIPVNVDMTEFRLDPRQRDMVRRRYGLQEKVVFVYSGSVGGWNDPRVYADYILRMRDWQRPHVFVFIVIPNRVFRKRLLTAFHRKDVQPDEYLLLHAASHQMPSLLSAGDIGLQLMAVADPRMGTKFAEYLAMGLAVIVNSNVEGAAEFVNRFDVGVVLDLDAKDFFSRLEDLMVKIPEIRTRSTSAASRVFSNQVVAAKHRAIYEGLLGLKSGQCGGPDSGRSAI